MRRRAISVFCLCILALATTGCASLIVAFQPMDVGVPVLVLTTTAEDGVDHRQGIGSHREKRSALR